MTAPRVSVVMSAFSPQHLRPAVESILKQTFTDFEFVIVDDSAAAETSALLAEYAARDSRMVLARNPHNMGQTWSLNHGLTLARAELLARQDDDDLSEPTRLAEQVAHLDAHPAIGLLGTQAQIIDPAGALLRLTSYPTEPGAVAAALLRDCCLCHGSVMLRRGLIDRVGNFDGDLKPAEDYDLWLRLAEVTQVANLNAALYQFRLHSGSQSFKRRHQQMFNKAQALERALRRRYGATAPAELTTAPARDFIEAAVASLYVGDGDMARSSVARALAVNAAVLRQDEPLHSILNEYTASGTAEDQVRLVNGVFALLDPATSPVQRQKARFVSEVHMREVFAGLRAQQPARVQRHLWPGILHDPRWLLNRGVMAVWLRSIVGGG